MAKSLLCLSLLMISGSCFGKEETCSETDILTDGFAVDINVDTEKKFQYVGKKFSSVRYVLTPPVACKLLPTGNDKVQVFLKPDDWIGVFGFEDQFNRNPMTAQEREIPISNNSFYFKLSPFGNTSVVIKSETKTNMNIKCNLHKNAYKRRKYYLLVSLLVVAFSRRLSHFGLLHYGMAMISALLLILFLVAIFIWRMPRVAFLGGVVSGAGVYGAHDNIGKIFDGPILYVLIFCFFFMLYLFQQFKNNALSCCGVSDSRARAHLISYWMNFLLCLLGLAAIYLRSSESTFWISVFMVLAMLGNVFAKYSNDDEDAELYFDKREVLQKLESRDRSSCLCCCCRAAPHEYTSDELTARNTQNAVQDLLNSDEGREWALQNRHRFELNPPPDDPVDYNLWAKNQCGGNEVRVRREKDALGCILL